MNTVDIIAIIGSRTKDKDDSNRVRALVGPRVRSGTSKTIYVSGGCPTGADYWCRYFCNLYEKGYLEAPAFWQRPTDSGVFGGYLDRGAGHRRNRLIVDISSKILAFWDGKSPGTSKTIEYARSVGKPVEVVPI